MNQKTESNSSSNSIHYAEEFKEDKRDFNEQGLTDFELFPLPESLKGMTEEEITKLGNKTRLKIDLRILPVLVFMYVMDFLNRGNIATARLGGLEKDLKFKGTDYQVCISILFVGYIPMQIPCNLLMSKMGRPSLFLTILMFCWGVVSTCMGAAQSFGGMVALRILLGFAEAGFFPACLFYLSSWYTKKELAMRNSIFYSGIYIASAFAGLIGAGILDNMEGVRGLRAWRWLFIIEGAISVGFVPIAYFMLADNPNNTKWLSQQEKDVIQWKLSCEVGQADTNEIEAKNTYWASFKLSVVDIKVWLVTGMASFLTAAQSITNFFPSVVQTLKFNKITTLCLVAPPYLLAIPVTYFWAWHADKTGERFYHIMIPVVICLVAFIIGVSTLNVGARYFAMMIMPLSMYPAFSILMTWMSNLVPRPALKRGVSLALMNSLGGSTAIWVSFLYPISAAPRYTVAFTCNAVFLFLTGVLCVMLRFYLGYLNRQIERGTFNWEKELGEGKGASLRSDFKFLY